MLYIVATPIGNLKDITYRAVEMLMAAEYILCEDTRTSLKLLQHYNINKPLKAYHKFNESTVKNKIIADLKAGKEIALISDAGTPGISDPGNVLINECITNNVAYTIIPGASAAVNAFVVSGFAPPYTYVGFLPEKQTVKTQLLERLKNSEAALVFYISPHSMEADFSFLASMLGNRKMCVVRELTKKFEEISFSTLENGYSGDKRGEFVVVVEAVAAEKKQIDVKAELIKTMQAGFTKKDAVNIVAKEFGVKKSDVYKVSLEVE